MYAKFTNNAWTEFGPDANGNAVTQNGMLAWSSFELWPVSEKESVGIFAVADDAIPDGKVATGSSLSDRAGRPVRTFTLINTPPPMPPEEISDRQFAQQLAVEGVITQSEALAWVSTGVLPANMAGLVSQLPTEQQFPAKMLLCGAKTYQRHHPMTGIFAQMYGWDSTKLDAVWAASAAL